MKTLTIRFLVPIVVFTVAYSQGQPSPRSRVDIYSTALIEASKEMEKQWANLSPDQSQTTTDYKHLLVYKDESVRATYPDAAGGRRYEYLTHAQLLARRRNAKKDFSVLTVSPAIVERPRIKVVAALDWVSLVKGHLGLGMSDWADVFFRFDCQNGEFRFDQVKLGGI